MPTKKLPHSFHLLTLLTLVAYWGQIPSGIAIADIVVAPDGSNGNPGQPHGGNGGDGISATASSTPVSGVVSATGGKGGQGGKGEDGSPPGMGGHGGRGGNAVASQNTAVPTFEVKSQGGNGGNGGGQGVSPVVTDGGNGGNGGSATTTVFFSNQIAVDANLSARGGDGGAAGAGTGNGGRGGNASSTGSSESFVDTNFEMNVQGGNGGGATIGNGGNGGEASASGTQQNQLNGASVRVLASEFEAIGGNGGTSEFGNGGLGGKASATLQVNNPKGEASATATARGGNSGASGLGTANPILQTAEARATAISSDSSAHAIANAYGGNGGAKTNTDAGMQGTSGGNAQAFAYGSGPQNVEVSVNAYGGQGGSVVNGTGGVGGEGFVERAGVGIAQNVTIEMRAFGGKGGDVINGTGGTGGSGRLGTPLLVGNFIDMSKLTASVTGQVHGGDGGNATGNGQGGNGASVNLNDAVSVNNTLWLANRLKVYQDAFGGDAGSSSSLVYGAGTAGAASSKLNVFGINNTSLEAGASATGGNGGTALGQFINKGGDAVSDVAVTTNVASASATGYANSLGGNGTVGGSASANSASYGIAGTAYASAISKGGDGVSSGPTASSAASQALSRSLNGVASSYARASNAKDSVATAQSEGATAYSRSHSSGDGGQAWAKSNLKELLGINLNAYMQSTVNTSAHVATVTSVQGGMVPDIRDAYSYSYLLANQTDPAIESFIQGQTKITQKMYDNPNIPYIDYDALSTGEFAIEFAPDGTAGNLQLGQFENKISLQSAAVFGRELFLGLFDGELDGFSSDDSSWSLTVWSPGSSFYRMWNSEMVDFKNLFSDNPISMGMYDDRNGNSNSFIQVNMNWQMTDLDDSFSGKFIVTAAAVPEPSSIVVMGLIASAGIGRAIRNRKKKAELV